METHGRLPWYDWVLCAAVAFGGLAEAFSKDGGWRFVAAALALVLALTMAIRRTRPLPALLLGVGALFVVDVASVMIAGAAFQMVTAGVVVILLYSVFRWAPGRQAAIGLTLVVGVWLWSVLADYSGSTDAIGGLAVLLLAAALGLALRYRSIVTQQRMDSVRLQEREMLARELHDTVGHHVSAIAIQAQAGQARGDLAGATQALQLIEREATTTMAEMRSMVAALREPAALGRGLADLPELTENSRLPVEVSVSGDVEHLSPAVQATIYRVVQESITNTGRHARHASCIDVTIVGDREEVSAHIHDDGDRAGSVRSGFGLVGMSERVSLLGGTFAAGPDADGGWTVRATIPR